MHRFARFGVAGVLLVVAAGLLVAPPASSAPSPGGPAAKQTSAIYPVPRSTSAGKRVDLSGSVNLVVGADTDQVATSTLRTVLSEAGAVVNEFSPDQPLPAGGTAVYLGTDADNAALASALASIGVAAGEALSHPDGYLLATGRQGPRQVLVLDGHDGSGAFYAVQSLRQIVSNGIVQPLVVRDWPDMPIRGAIEGFYGFPWSHQARLDQLEFYGRQKMNTYIYSPKDDPLLRARWREQYSGDQLAQLSELVATATANHVNFTYALSPGNDLCYSSDADQQATVAKFQSLYNIGVRSFYIALDDIPQQLHCTADQQKFTKPGIVGIADAQAFYLNAIDDTFIKSHPDLQPLQMVPTNYTGSGPDAYKTELGAQMAGDILLQWTGEQVVSHRITTASARAAETSYGTATRPRSIFIWDNYPVNDFAQDRLFLAPVIGRDTDLYTAIDGITSNPMIEPYASMPALFNYADYTWNAAGYDPKASMAMALQRLAGTDPTIRTSLAAFADLNQNWQDDELTPNAPALSKDIADFWHGWLHGTTSRGLINRIAVIRAMPQQLAAMDQQGFYDDAQHWIAAAGHYGDAMAHAVTMLRAVRSGDGVAVIRERSALEAARAEALTPTQPTLDQGLKTPKVGDAVIQRFLADAESKVDFWLGLTRRSTTIAQTSFPAYQTNTPDKMLDGDLSTLFWTSRTPVIGDYIGVDVGQVQRLRGVTVRQSDADTVQADMMYHAKLSYSTDGTTWTDAGTFDNLPVIAATFDQPVNARYVRITATAINPGTKWVKIREFALDLDDPSVTSTIPTAAGSTLGAVIDGNLDTGWRAARPAEAGDVLSYRLPAPVTSGTVTVIGTAAGDVQMQRDGQWLTIGRLDPAGFTRLAAGAGTAVRIAFAPGGSPPAITEIVVR